MLTAFVVLRGLNVPGDKPYPPSPQFLLQTLDIGVILLVVFERFEGCLWLNNLAVLADRRDIA